VPLTSACLPLSCTGLAGGGSEQEKMFSAAAALYVLMLSWLWHCGPRMVRTDNRTYGGAREFPRNVSLHVSGKKKSELGRGRQDSQA
jgi:hypothetical protein